ncbi:MAG: DUF3379 family protein [Steroidobacter sp.]
MNCEELRAIVGAEPNTTRPDVLAHLEQCPECARFREEMQAMDRLIYRALAVDVQPAATPALPRSNTRVWRMAASVLITAVVVAFTSIWLLTPQDSFAAEVIAHIEEEPDSLLITDESVDAADLEKLLSKIGVRLKPGTAHVSYATPCTFRGQLTPHLVVQTEHGPITVLVMPEEPTRDRQRINEEGFQGVILPAPRGVIVVVGIGAPADEVAETVLGALEYW